MHRGKGAAVRPRAAARRKGMLTKRGALGSASCDQERVQGEKEFPVFCTDMQIATNLPNMIQCFASNKSLYLLNS